LPKEANTPGVKPGNEAKIVWAKTAQDRRRPWLLFIHGFRGREEGAPVHTNSGHFRRTSTSPVNTAA
jgi:hypothetical protein